MRFHIGRSWGSIVLLSILLPVGLLATLRLTGVLQEPMPTPAKTITLEAISWNMTRPKYSDLERIEPEEPEYWKVSIKETLKMEERVKYVYSDDATRIYMTLWIHDYYENNPSGPVYGWDGLILGAFANVTASQGYTSEITVKFQPTDPNAVLFIDTNAFDWYQSYGDVPYMYNVSVTKVKATGTNVREAYAKATTSNNPASFRVQAYWVFIDENPEDHRLNANFEVRYSDGTAYRKVILPVVLEVSVSPI